MRPRPPLEQAVAAARETAAVLASAHRFGLAHGRLHPRRIARTGPRNLKLDFTGIEVHAGRHASASESSTPFQAPEVRHVETAGVEADVYSLGAIVLWLVTGRAVPSAGEKMRDRLLPAGRREDDLEVLIREMLAIEPSERPPAKAVEVRLAALLGSSAAHAYIDSGETMAGGSGGRRASPDAGRLPTLREKTLGEQLGRFRLREKLGQGGMGAVYRRGSGRWQRRRHQGAPSAFARRPASLAAFQKEARLLAQVHHPNVANLLEVNEDDGIYYLVMEFVTGHSLSAQAR